MGKELTDGVSTTMACLNPKKVRRSDMTGSRYKMLRTLEHHGVLPTEEFKTWLTPMSQVRGDLTWLVDRHLVAPVSSSVQVTEEVPGFTATAYSRDGRSSVSTSKGTRRVSYSTPRSVATEPLLWVLTSTGAAAAFQGITVRGLMSVPDRGRHWVCPRGTALRELAVRRLAQGEVPFDPPSVHDELVDEFIFALTCEHSEREAYAQMRVHREDLDGFSFAEQLRAGDAGVERALVSLERHLVREAARSYRGPLGVTRAASSDPTIVAINRRAGSWGFSHGFADSIPGRLAWCCTTPGDHNHLDVAARLRRVGLLDADPALTAAR